jgi:hypothetical protein
MEEIPGPRAVSSAGWAGWGRTPAICRISGRVPSGVQKEPGSRGTQVLEESSERRPGQNLCLASGALRAAARQSALAGDTSPSSPGGHRGGRQPRGDSAHSIRFFF